MDPFLFALLLALGVAVGWAVGKVMANSSSELPLYLVLGGIGALLGGAMAQLTINPQVGSAVLLTVGLATAILLLTILHLGRGRLAG